MGERRFERRRAAVLADDVVGYRRQMGEDETGAHVPRSRDVGVAGGVVGRGR